MNKSNSTKIPCSVGVLTFNNEAVLDACLSSVRDFAEIIICDGGSTDRTLEIAKRYGCKIIMQDQQYKYDNNKIANFAGVRNQTLNAATQDWFLIVDSDEFLSPEVVSEIAETIQKDTPEKPKVFNMPRKFVIEGRVVECAAGYPNFQTRFFHRGYVTEFYKNVHERIRPKEGVKTAFLKQATIVPTSVDYKAIKKKNAYYLKIEKERSRSLPRRNLLLGSYKNLTFAAKRVIKVVLNLVRCRGYRMPLRKEWMAFCYSLRLSWIFLCLALAPGKKDVLQ